MRVSAYLKNMPSLRTNLSTCPPAFLTVNNVESELPKELSVHFEVHHGKGPDGRYIDYNNTAECFYLAKITHNRIQYIKHGVNLMRKVMNRMIPVDNSMLVLVGRPDYYPARLAFVNYLRKLVSLLEMIRILLR